MKTIVLIACCFLLLQANGFAQKKPATKKDMLLAGKTFTVELVEKDAKKKDKSQADEISFKGDKINSKFMIAELKMPASPYTATVDSAIGDGTIAFTSECKNSDGDILTWEGTTIPDGTIEGIAKLSKKGKIKKEYSFTGTLKQKTKK